MQKKDWTRYVTEIEVEKGKKVKEMDFSFVGEDFEGEIHITDLQLQKGKQVTMSIPHTSGILRHKYGDLDETAILDTVNDPKEVLGSQPKVYRNVKNRFYNFVGRGHEAIAVPNVFEERYDDPTITTVLDLTLVAKDDFDLLRVSSIHGTELTGYDRIIPGIHPLNTRYSREFFIEGGRRGDEIRLFGSTGEATINGRPLDRRPRKIKIGSAEIDVKRQDFMSAPSESFRVRIEFYTLSVYGTLEDTGVGFQGVAELVQWGIGKSKF